MNYFITKIQIIVHYRYDNRLEFQQYCVTISLNFLTKFFSFTKLDGEQLYTHLCVPTKHEVSSANPARYLCLFLLKKKKGQYKSTLRKSALRQCNLTLTEPI